MENDLTKSSNETSFDSALSKSWFGGEGGGSLAAPPFQLESSSYAGTGTPGSGVMQRVATNLIAGLDADKPSTYDTGGGHSYSSHGAHTTKEQHIHRVKKGIAPDGRKSKVPPGKPSSKFSSDSKHVVAFKQALTQIQEKNNSNKKVKGAGNQIDVAGAGILYYGDGTEAASNKVQLDIQPVNDNTIRVNSMYPVA